MKIVIDIPKELKQKIDEGFTNQVIVNKLWDATRNGTPIPDNEPKTGKWEFVCQHWRKCSECGFSHKFAEGWDYCPNCGAKMERSKT